MAMYRCGEAAFRTDPDTKEREFWHIFHECWCKFSKYPLVADMHYMEEDTVSYEDSWAEPYEGMEDESNPS